MKTQPPASSTPAGRSLRRVVGRCCGCGKKLKLREGKVCDACYSTLTPGQLTDLGDDE